MNCNDDDGGGDSDNDDDDNNNNFYGNKSFGVASIRIYPAFRW
jgi:hypothetical protein